MNKYFLDINNEVENFNTDVKNDDAKCKEYLKDVAKHNDIWRENDMRTFISNAMPFINSQVVKGDNGCAIHRGLGTKRDYRDRYNYTDTGDKSFLNKLKYGHIGLINNEKKRNFCFDLYKLKFNTFNLLMKNMYSPTPISCFEVNEELKCNTLIHVDINNQDNTERIAGSMYDEICTTKITKILCATSFYTYPNCDGPDIVRRLNTGTIEERYRFYDSLELDGYKNELYLTPVNDDGQAHGSINLCFKHCTIVNGESGVRTDYNGYNGRYITPRICEAHRNMLLSRFHITERHKILNIPVIKNLLDPINNVYRLHNKACEHIKQTYCELLFTSGNF